MGRAISKRGRSGVLGATLAALLVVALASATVAAAAPRVRVVTADQVTLLAQNQLTVRVTPDRAARLRLRFLISNNTRTVRLVPQRTLTFARRQSRTVRLRLSSAGRTMVKRERALCRRTLLTAYAYRRDRGRRGRLLKSRRGLAAGGGCATGTGKAPSSGRPLLAGAASRDITPPIGTPMFAYTARSLVAGADLDAALQVISDPDTNLYAKSFEASKGIHTRVRASAIVLQGERGKFVLAQADLGGLPYALTQEVLKRLPANSGITADRLLLSATHTHSSTGPIWPADSSGYALLGGDAFDPRIFSLTADGIAAAIKDADSKLVPARAGVGTSELRDASRNRAFDPFKKNPDVAAGDDAAKRRDSIDPTVTVLRVDALDDGRPLGVWSNFAVHPTSFGDDNLLFSGDNAGFAERAAEAEITRAAVEAGRPAGSVVNVWTNGAQGDISPNGDAEADPGPGLGGGGGEGAPNPLDYVTSSYAKAHLAGRRVGQGIAGAWRDAGTRLNDGLDLDARRTFLRFDGTPATNADGDTVGATIVLGAGIAADGQCGPEDAAGPGQGKKQFLAGGELVPRTVPVSVLRAGRLGIAAFPAEVTKQMGQRIRNRLVADSGGQLERVALAGLTNAYVSYTSTPQEYDACQYEGSFTLFGREQGARFRDIASGLVKKLGGGVAPPQPEVAEPPSLAASSGEVPTPRTTPDAGKAVQEPVGTVVRHGRAAFRWEGGDPAFDAPRDRALVTVEREVNGAFVPFATDDGGLDITELDRASDVWTETLQIDTCDPVGRYRFRVTGRADKGAGPVDYALTSTPFTVAPLTGLTAGPVTVDGTTARVTAEYPNPGPQALLSLPRRVRTGTVTLRVTEPGQAPKAVRATPDERGLQFRATVAAGSTVSVLRVEDGCGNTGN